MKKITQTYLTATGIFMMLCVMLSSCKKDNKNTSETTKPFVTEMKATINGKEVNLNSSALKTTYYASNGDAVKALETSATLNTAGDKLNFFIGELMNGQIALTKKSGTSLNPRGRDIKLRLNDINNTTQTYVQYLSGGNVYYAYNGSIEISITDQNITIKWSISFKDAAGKEFTSAGTFSIANYMANVKPKSEIKDPTPVADKPTIENIDPNEGFAGDTVSITGVNYSTTPADNVVLFNGVKANVIAATATNLSVIVPQGATNGALSLKVKNSETITGPQFNYIVPATFTAITPATGKIGDIITITGTNFGTTAIQNMVKFNGVKAEVVSATATKLMVVVPANATSGLVTLSVKGGATLPGKQFAVTAPPAPTGIWEETQFTVGIQETTLSAAVGKSFMFTGGSFPDYLYYTPDDNSYENIYSKLPFDKTKHLEIHLLKADGEYFYITSNLGIARTKDGQTWTKLSPSAMDMNITGLIAKNGNLTLLVGSFLYQSADAGDTWTSSYSQTGSGLEYITSDSFGKYFYAINQSANFLASTTPRKIYKSADKGKTWAPAGGTTGLYFFGSGNQDFIDASGYTIFCLFSGETTRASIVDQRLYKTSDQGETWTTINDEPYYNVKCFGDYVAYGGSDLKLSVDGGNTFKNYAIPSGYFIGGVERADGYIYIFCYSRGQGPYKYRIFRQKM